MPILWKHDMKHRLWSKHLADKGVPVVETGGESPPSDLDSQQQLAAIVLVTALRRAYIMSKGNLSTFRHLGHQMHLVSKTQSYFAHLPAFHQDVRHWVSDPKTTNLYRVHLAVFRNVFALWDSYLPPNGAFFLAYCTLIATVLDDMSSILLEVVKEATHFRLPAPHCVKK